jgi:hypothetical protein
MANDSAEASVERGAAEEGSGTPLTPTEVEASRRPPSAPGNHDETTSGQDDSGTADVTGAAPPMSSGDPDDAPLLTGDDVRLGPEQTDMPQAGGTEPTD